VRSRLALLAVVLATAASLWMLADRVRLDPDVAALLPDSGQGATLRQYVRAFGGGDLAMVLVRGDDPETVRTAADQVARALSGCPHVLAAVNQVHPPRSSDPSLAWAFADEPSRQRLAAALDPEAMRLRLAETRALLLGPGAASLRPELAQDPLRLRQLAWSGRAQVAASGAPSETGWLGTAGGDLVADDGRARLVVLAPDGEALRGRDAHAAVRSIEQCLQQVRSAHGTVSIDVTGGHAIAAATEDMIRRDLQWSGAVSVLLVSAVFALTFRRLRALVAVMPPLAMGTLWSAALGGLLLGRLSAISIAFVAVVVGVGVDTGVHVYAALLEARRGGLPPAEAARQAASTTARPTLIAAATASAAFGALGLSSIRALQQLGVLCALGELLTAIAILVVTPTLGAWLERGHPPPERQPRWTDTLDRITRWRWATVALAAIAAIPAAALVIRGMPRFNDAFVAIRPSMLDPVRTLDRVYALFGGGARQWVAIVSDRDLDAARTRSDRLFERLASATAGVADIDALGRLAPSLDTQRARLEDRDRLDLPSRVPDLRAALQAEGFAPDRFDAAFAWMASPAHRVHDPLDEGTAAAALLRARFVGHVDDRWYVATYVRPRPGHEAQVERAVAEADPQAVLTGYSRLDSALRSALVHDLPRIGLAAALLVIAAMAGALRSRRELGIALATLGLEAVWVLAVVRSAGIRLHAYNFMVLPVLLGVTVDESMFLLHRARADGMAEALRREGPSVVATGATTAAGFGALLVCRYDALADMGWLGLAGVLIGLASSLVVVPALGHRSRAG